MPTMLSIARCPGLHRHRMFLFVLVTVLAGCAGAGASNGGYHSYVYRSGDSYVRLDPIEAGARANAHPYVVSADQLNRWLALVNVKGAASVGMVRLFSKEELEKIVPPLAVALSTARPNEDVTFAVASHRGMFADLSPKSITTGRLFADADSVNLILGVVQQRLNADESDYGVNAPKITAGMRAHRVDTTVWKIDPGRARFHGQRGDWLVFERTTSPATATGRVSAPATKSSGEAGAAAPTIDSKERQIEERLQLLNRLKQKGVITEKEYRERRRAILEEL